MNVVILVFFVIFPLVFSQQTTLDGCFHVWQNRRMTCAYPLERRTAISERNCLSLCLNQRSHRCNSVNYNPQLQICDVFRTHVNLVRNSRTGPIGPSNPTNYGSGPSTYNPGPSIPQPYNPRPSVPQPYNPGPSIPSSYNPEPSIPQPYNPGPSIPSSYNPGPSIPQPYNPGPSIPQPYNPGPLIPQPYNPGPSISQPYNPGPSFPQPYNPGPLIPSSYNPGPSIPQPYNPGPSIPQPYNPGPLIPSSYNPGPSIPQPYNPGPSIPQPSNPGPLIPSGYNQPQPSNSRPSSPSRPYTPPRSSFGPIGPPLQLDYKPPFSIPKSPSPSIASGYIAEPVLPLLPPSYQVVRSDATRLIPPNFGPVQSKRSIYNKRPSTRPLASLKKVHRKKRQTNFLRSTLIPFRVPLCQNGPQVINVFGGNLYRPTGLCTASGISQPTPAPTTQATQRSPNRSPPTEATCSSGEVIQYLRAERMEVRRANKVPVRVSSVQECLGICSENRLPDGTESPCRSAEYDRDSSICRISLTALAPRGNGGSTENPNVIYHEKICLSSKLSQNCPNPILFSPQHVLVGFAQTVLDAQGLADCLQKCYQSQKNHGFRCNSGMIFYQHAELNCVLNVETKETQSRSYTTMNEELVDYFEPGCVPRPLFRDTPNRNENVLSSLPIWGPWTPCDRNRSRQMRFRGCEDSRPTTCEKHGRRCQSIRKISSFSALELRAGSTKCSMFVDCCAVRVPGGEKDCKIGRHVTRKGLIRCIPTDC